MDDKDRKTLIDNLDRLSENCNFENVLGFLKANDIFTRRQLQRYESEEFNMKAEELKCQELFKDIQTRGPHAFKILLECFKNTGHLRHYDILRRPSHMGNPESQQLSVRKSTSFPHSTTSVYKMTSYPKGYYIFINNMKFRMGEERTGAEQDQKFQEVLEDMGFKGEYHTNKTTQEMRDLLINFSMKDEFAQVDSCIVAISSHGSLTASKELAINGCDDVDQSNPLLCNEVISYFNSDECKLRAGQPKVFIIQACRGYGYIRNYGEVNFLSEVAESHQTWTNTFFLAPCIEGLTANRNPCYGSWLFRALTEVFMVHAHNKDLVEMKDLINQQFDVLYEDTLRQQTCSLYEHGVGKKLYFNPGLYERRDN